MFKVLWNYGLVIPGLFNVFFILSSAALAAKAPDLSELKSGVEELSPSIATQPESNQTANLEVTETPDYLLFQEASLLSQETSTEQDDSLAQVNSVSELSDVQPTDWAFQALQSLVERYGAIAGYTDGTFKGDRALTRYEFAAGLNTALDRINQIISRSAIKST